MHSIINHIMIYVCMYVCMYVYVLALAYTFLFQHERAREGSNVHMAKLALIM